MLQQPNTKLYNWYNCEREIDEIFNIAKSYFLYTEYFHNTNRCAGSDDCSAFGTGMSDYWFLLWICWPTGYDGMTIWIVFEWQFHLILLQKFKQKIFYFIQGTEIRRIEIDQEKTDFLTNKIFFHIPSNKALRCICGLPGPLLWGLKAALGDGLRTVWRHLSPDSTTLLYSAYSAIINQFWLNTWIYR